VTGRSLLLVCTLSLLWGSSFALIKIAVQTIPPFTLGAVRGLLGGLLLASFMGRDLPSLWRSGVPMSTFWVQAVLNCFIPWTVVAWASRTIDSSLATVLNSLSPIFAFLLTWGITRHEAVTARKFVGVLLGLAGVFVIVGLDAFKGLGQHTVAEVACLVGSLSYGAAAVVGSRFKTVSPLIPAAGSTLLSSVLMIPLALAFEAPWALHPSMPSMLSVLGLAVFSTGIAFVIYFKLISTVGSIGTTSQAYLRILVGIGVGIAFLGESPSASLFAGALLVVLGVIAMTMPARRPLSRPRP
jgi:drug/metabolite transporter (DMT)-like permease